MICSTNLILKTWGSTQLERWVYGTFFYPDCYYPKKQERKKKCKLYVEMVKYASHTHISPFLRTTYKLFRQSRLRWLRLEIACWDILHAFTYVRVCALIILISHGACESL